MADDCLSGRLLALAGLGAQPSAASAAPSAIVGLSEIELVQCAGLPQGSMSVGDATFYQYSSLSERGQVVPLGNSLFVTRRTRGCEATVKVQNGRVVDVTTQSHGGLLTGPLACQRLFSGCQ